MALRSLRYRLGLRLLGPLLRAHYEYLAQRLRDDDTNEEETSSWLRGATLTLLRIRNDAEVGQARPQGRPWGVVTAVNDDPVAFDEAHRAPRHSDDDPCVCVAHLDLAPCQVCLAYGRDHTTTDLTAVEIVEEFLAGAKDEETTRFLLRSAGYKQRGAKAFIIDRYRAGELDKPRALRILDAAGIKVKTK